MELTEQQERVKSNALEFARANKKAIARRMTNPEIYIPEASPVSVFMAGSPGAGKTEASIALLTDLEKDGARVLRIDPDDLRSGFDGYSGPFSTCSGRMN